MELVNLLLLVVALGLYALVGLALLGMAIVRFRGWEVNRTLLPAPVRFAFADAGDVNAGQRAGRPAPPARFGLCRQRSRRERIDLRRS